MEPVKITEGLLLELFGIIGGENPSSTGLAKLAAYERGPASGRPAPLGSKNDLSCEEREREKQETVGASVPGEPDTGTSQFCEPVTPTAACAGASYHVCFGQFELNFYPDN